LIRKAERSIPFGSIRIEILHPPDPLNLFHVKENDRSLVVRIKSESHSVLLTGDIEYRAEQLLVKERDQVKADVLKVAHHGSRTSTSKSFLGAVQPTQAVVSAGFANRYGHPSPKVLRRLENLGVRVWRGDLCGEIVASLCQGSISLSSVRDCGN
jgi:competence protein ComEC